MVKVGKVITVLGFMLFLVTSGLLAQDDQHAYVGAARCMPCHMSPAKGAQYRQWQGTEHAKAYEVLGTDEAKQVAQDAGVSGNPQEASECLTCHVTGYDAPADLKTDKYDMAEGVTCETCHGPGGDYWQIPVMKSVYAGETDPASVGLTPDPGHEELCVQCHNDKSPTFTGFNFDEALQKVSHPMPEN